MSTPTVRAAILATGGPYLPGLPVVLLSRPSGGRPTLEAVRWFEAAVEAEEATGHPTEGGGERLTMIATRAAAPRKGVGVGSEMSATEAIVTLKAKVDAIQGMIAIVEKGT